LENLGKLVGFASGRFALIIETIRSNDSFTQEIEGRLNNGILEGMVTTYLVLDGQRYLVSEVTYRSDLQEGPIASYYPMTGQVQMTGSYVEGLKSGEFELFYPNGKLSVKMPYGRDILEGLCDVYDNTGTRIASGIYRNGEYEGGTLVENLETFIQESISGQPMTVHIVTIKGAQVVEVVEKRINQRP